MKVTIEGTKYEMSTPQMREMLTEGAFKLIRRVKKQGGSVNLGIGAFAPQYREMITKNENG